MSGSPPHAKRGPQAGARSARSASAVAAARRVRGWRPSRAAFWVLLAGLTLSVVLALVARLVYDRNEDRLLRTRASELGLLVGSAVGSIEMPLASAAGLADVTGASRRDFDQLLRGYVGPGERFASASLWRAGASRPLALLGGAPAILARPAHERSFFATAARTAGLSVTGLLESAHPRLAYAYHVPDSTAGLFVYAEDVLPADRRSRLQNDAAFASLRYAVYLGAERPRDLLVTNLSRVPPSGRVATQAIPFADRHLTLVVAAEGSLGGTFFRDLPATIGILGVLLAAAAAILVDRLANGRRRAEELAGLLDEAAEENRALYAEQRSIAKHLQAALIGDDVPAFDGLEVSARYVAGTSGIDVGGDWYDLIALDDGRAMLVVGDVSGRGLEAATTMAFLRDSIIAYAAEADDPAVVLGKLSRLVDREPHDYFATVLCARLDVAAHTARLASAGHLPPLLVERGRARFVELPVGPPIGAASAAEYLAGDIAIRPHATLIGFTDGLVERRGESLDVGLERLRSATGRRGVTLERLVGRLLRELAHDEMHDDTAILAVRWRD